MRLWMIALVFTLFPLPLLAQQSEEEEAVRELLVKTYVEGLHITRDLQAVRRGFHPDFIMHVYDNGQVIQAPLEMWLERLQLDGTRNPKLIDYQFDLIDITGNSAVVKMQIYEESQHLYTDYFGLYKFESGWKIMNKIFYGHN